MVNKKDGSHKFCIDFRKVTKVTKVGSFPMPFDADAPDSLANTSVFSTLDGSQKWFLANRNVS